MKLSEVNSTKTAQLVKSILYLILFLTTYFFVHELFEEYFQGKTYFSASKQPLTVEDMPTLTICPSGSRVNGLLIPRRYVEQVTSPDILPPDFKNPYLYVPTHLCSQSFCSQLLFPSFFIIFVY